MRSLIRIFARRTCPKLCLQTFRLIYLFICLFISNPLQAHLPVALKNGFYFLFNVYPLYPTPYNEEGTWFRQKLEAICFSEDSKYLLCARNLLLRELSFLKKKRVSETNYMYLFGYSTINDIVYIYNLDIHSN